MAYGIVLRFEDVNADHYWSVNEKLGIDGEGNGDYPAGLLAHAGGPTPDGWVVVELWDAKASHETWMASRLGAALAATGVPAPVQVIETDTVNHRLFG